MMQQPKVSVCMITYGHEKFIEQAINGVLMQECDFEVELIIANDCSPDKTEEVIQNILENHPRASWIKYIKHEMNIGMMPNFLFALNQCKGAFVAMCEGDDYWTNPLKLQKQVDFLEANKEYSICWTKYDKVDFSGNLIDENLPIFNQSLADVTVDTFFENYRTWTLTCVLKASVLKKYDFLKFKYLKDNTIFFAAMNDSKGRVLDFNSACYRIHDCGVWSSSTNLNKYLADFYNYNEIKNKIVYTPSLDYIVKRNLNDIVQSLIGYENCELIGINVFNGIFFHVVTKLSLTNKMRFLKWYLIKCWNISKLNFKTH